MTLNNIKLCAGGNISLCAGGNIELCSDCYDDLIAAIIERQGACNRSQWSTPITKTLAESITEVNACAPSFLSGTYSGGASAPPVLSSSYANGASDYCELLELVKAMLTTVVDSSIKGDQRYRWFAIDSSYAAAYAAAIAAGPTTYYGSYSVAHVYWSTELYSSSPDQYRVFAHRYRLRTELSGMYTGLTKALRLFAMAIAVAPPSGDSIFDKQNESIPDENQFGVIQSDDLGVAASYNGAWLFDSSSAPPNKQVSPPDTLRYYGFTILSGYALLDWDFTHI